MVDSGQGSSLSSIERLSHINASIQMVSLRNASASTNLAGAPPSAPPLVSIVMPCRNERQKIKQSLTSAINQVAPPGGFEVIVADGLSDDGTRQILHTFENGTAKVRVVDNPGLIPATGLNAAIRVARGDVIVRMDAHAEYEPDYICRCVEVLGRTASDNVGGPARTKADTYVGRGVAAAYHSPFAVGGARFHNVEYEGSVDTVTYGCWPRGTFERFGYFDEELGRNEDDEHNFRIIRGGGKVWQSSKIRSWYWPRSSLGTLFRQYMQYGYWKVRVIQKHKVPASWRHLVPGAFVLTLLLLILVTSLSHVVPAVSGPGSDLGSLSVALRAPVNFFLWSVLGLYGLCLLGASLATAAKTEWKLLPLLPPVFCCYHFGYGWGFLIGVVHFILLRRSASHAFTRVTRNRCAA